MKTISKRQFFNPLVCTKHLSHSLQLQSPLALDQALTGVWAKASTIRVSASFPTITSSFNNLHRSCRDLQLPFGYDQIPSLGPQELWKSHSITQLVPACSLGFWNSLASWMSVGDLPDYLDPFKHETSRDVLHKGWGPHRLLYLQFYHPTVRPCGFHGHGRRLVCIEHDIHGCSEPTRHRSRV